MIKGYATLKGTNAYFERSKVVDSMIVEGENFSTSKLGLGTHLGNFSEEDSKLYQQAIRYALTNGINLIDTAVNYRGMISERDIGKVLTELIEEGLINREEIVISSKAGIIPGDGEIMLKPVDYLKTKFIDAGILKREDVYMYENLRLTMNPNYFQYALNLSREHMNIETIDIHYIHEPELSISVLGEDEFYKNLEKVIEFYEEQVEIGKIKEYGMATWDAFQIEEDKDLYLSLEKVMKVVEGINKNHNFKHIMLPYNLDRPEANKNKTQVVNGKRCTIIEAANHYGIKVNTSGSIGKAKGLKEGKTVRDYLEFICKTEGVNNILVGMKRIEHMKGNLLILKGLLS